MHAFVTGPKDMFNNTIVAFVEGFAVDCQTYTANTCCVWFVLLSIAPEFSDVDMATVDATSIVVQDAAGTIAFAAKSASNVIITHFRNS